MAQSREVLIEQIEQHAMQMGRDRSDLRAALAEMHPADLAELIDEVSEPARLRLFDLLDVEVAGDVLDETEPGTATFFFEEVPDERLADILEALPVDDAARLLSTQEADRAGTLIGLMEPDDAADLRQALAYPAGTAGRIMNDNFVRLRGRWTVAETFDYLRRTDPQAETVTYLYVMDGEEHLTGVVPLRRLVMAEPEVTIADIQQRNVIAVPVAVSQEAAAEMMSTYDFSSLPVVDEVGRLVGIIAADDIVDVLEEEATEDIQRFGGSEPLNYPYFSISIPRMAQKRVGWLLMLFLGGTLTASVIAFFEDELAQLLTLSAFMPLLIGTGGNSGSQTVSIVIRALALAEIEWRDGLRVLAREFATGLTVGGMMGVVTFLFALILWQVDVPLALVVALTMPMIVTWSTVVGGVVPLLAEKVGIDPTVISAPLITTLVDGTGLVIYFLTAKMILGL